MKTITFEISGVSARIDELNRIVCTAIFSDGQTTREVAFACNRLVSDEHAIAENCMCLELMCRFFEQYRLNCPKHLTPIDPRILIAHFNVVKFADVRPSLQLSVDQIDYQNG